MSFKKLVWLAAAAALLVPVVWFVSPLAAKDPAGQPAGRDATLTGKIVDLYACMTGEYASADHAKCTADCIRAGVPAALETPTGIVLLGQGAKSCSSLLTPLAFQDAEIKGKLYEKGGIKYLDIASATKVAAKPAGKMSWEEEEGEE